MAKRPDGVLGWYKGVVLVLLFGSWECIWIVRGYVENSLVNPPILRYQEFVARPVLIYHGKTLAKVFHNQSEQMIHCTLHELEETSDAEPILKNSGLEVRYPNFSTMLELINNCTRLEIPSEGESTLNNTIQENDTYWSSWPIWNGILPGTKWCGVGDIAESFEQLGSEVNVDICCRAHDNCPVKLKAFRADYGLINLSLYTKSHCDCDREFFACLKSSTNRMADAVGNFYFNVLKVQCLKERREFICVENRTDTNGFNICKKWSPDPNSKSMQVSTTPLKY